MDKEREMGKDRAGFVQGKEVGQGKESRYRMEEEEGRKGWEKGKGVILPPHFQSISGRLFSSDVTLSSERRDGGPAPFCENC